jgi:peptide subunit release factor RF-3
LHDNQAVGALAVQVVQMGLQAGHVLEAESNHPPVEQALRHLKVAQSSNTASKKSQHSKHLSADISQSLHLVEHNAHDCVVVST